MRLRSSRRGRLRRACRSARTRCGMGRLRSRLPSRRRRLLGFGCVALRVGCECGFQPTCDGGFNGGRCGLHEFAHRLKFVQNGFAIDAKLLGKFIYACFRYSILLSRAARIRARPLLIHGELVPSHRATMFVIPRLFPGRGSLADRALDCRVQHTQARGLYTHGLVGCWKCCLFRGFGVGMVRLLRHLLGMRLG